MAQQKTVTVLGGSGFLGKYVVRELARSGWRVLVVCRKPAAAAALKTTGDVGQVVAVRGNICDIASFESALAQSDAVVNLTGILFESGKQKFTTIHAQAPEKLAQAAAALDIKQFIHVSALGVDKASGSKYARSKVLGEKAVLAAIPTATILRPSVIFGPEDNFINQFACMASCAPALPLIGGGKTRFQPVYVADVASAVGACLNRTDAQGQIYELGGPQIYTFKEILEMIMRLTGKHRKLVNVPFGMAGVVGTFGELLPRPPLTRDQVQLLKHDNVVSPNTKGFAALGISPASMDVIVPDYLERFKVKAAA